MSYSYLRNRLKKESGSWGMHTLPILNCKTTTFQKSLSINHDFHFNLEFSTASVISWHIKYKDFFLKKQVVIMAKKEKKKEHLKYRISLDAILQVPMNCSFVWQLTLSQYSCLAIYLCFHKVKTGRRNIMPLPVIIPYLPTQRSKIPLAYWVEEDKSTLLNQSGEARMDTCADYLLHEIFPFLIPNNLSKEQIPYVIHSINIKWQTPFWEYEDEWEWCWVLREFFLVREI